jgi:hypothetical protein
LIGRAREIFKHITKVLNHCIVVGGIVTSYAQYLQCMMQPKVSGLC